MEYWGAKEGYEGERNRRGGGGVKGGSALLGLAAAEEKVEDREEKQ